MGPMKNVKQCYRLQVVVVVVVELSHNALGHCESSFGALPEGLFYLPPPSACITVYTKQLQVSRFSTPGTESHVITVVVGCWTVRQ